MTKKNKSLKLIQTAETLFKRYGIKRVTVDEICQKADISKMTFYKYFQNKIELAKTILNIIAERQERQYNSIMNQEIPYMEKVGQVIQMKLDESEDIGQELLKELWKDPEEEIAKQVQQIKQKSFKMLLDDLMVIQRKGDIRKDIRPEFIDFFLNKIIEMVKDEHLINIYPSTQALIAELLNFFFYGILPRELKYEK